MSPTQHPLSTRKNKVNLIKCGNIREDPSTYTKKNKKRDNYIKRCPCTLNENTLNDFIRF
jgi:hypothetical protein